MHSFAARQQHCPAEIGRPDLPPSEFPGGASGNDVSVLRVLVTSSDATKTNDTFAIGALITHALAVFAKTSITCHCYPRRPSLDRFG